MPDALTYHGWRRKDPAVDLCETGVEHAYHPCEVDPTFCARCGGPPSARGHQKAATAPLRAERAAAKAAGPNTIRRRRP